MSATMLLPPAPAPPAVPQNAEAFAEHSSRYPQEWFDYCVAMDTYVQDVHRLVQKETDEHRDEVEDLKASLNQKKGVCEYQQELQDKSDRRIRELQGELSATQSQRDAALQAAAPTVDTPPSASTTQAEKDPVTLLGTPSSATPPSTTTTTRVSERLPDPDKFDGDRADLRRFVSQIQEKMTANQDRYPTPQLRMSYVNNRLKGSPYALILPYIQGGVCQLPDYTDVLDKLDHAYGDPNRARNARNQLYRLRQGNKEFSLFFAEFQRLAIDGEMENGALPIMLEQAINRELQAMLLHHEPPAGADYQKLGTFLQDLENRRLQYERRLASNTRSTAVPATYTPATPKLATPAAPATLAAPRPAPQPQAPAPAAATAPPRDPDAMDLSATRRSTRRERGECYRCGSSSHMVRDCQLPDTRPARFRLMYTNDTETSAKPARRAVSPTRSVSPDLSVKGGSLI